MEFLDSFTWVDWICLISFSITFFASAPWGRKIWSVVECSGSFVFGVALILAPEIIVGLQVSGGQFDSVHAYLCRQVGAVLLGQATSLFLCRNSVDGRMFGSVFYSRVFSSLLLFVVQCYSAYHLSNQRAMHFNQRFIMFFCSTAFVWVLGSLVQLLRYKEFGGYIHKPSYITAVLWMDHFTLLFMGTLLFAFPSQILKVMIKQKAVNGVHVFLLRAAAALIIGHALTSGAAPGFLYSRDQRAHVIGRLTTHILVFSNNVFGHFVSDIFTLYHVTPFMVTGFYITFLLILFFRFNEATPVASAARTNLARPTLRAGKDQDDYSLDGIDTSDSDGTANNVDPRLSSERKEPMTSQ